MLNSTINNCNSLSYHKRDLLNPSTDLDVVMTLVKTLILPPLFFFLKKNLMGESMKTMKLVGLNCAIFSSEERDFFFLLKIETFSIITVVQEMALQENLSKS